MIFFFVIKKVWGPLPVPTQLPHLNAYKAILQLQNISYALVLLQTINTQKVFSIFLHVLFSQLSDYSPTKWLYFLQYGTPEDPHGRLGPADEHPFPAQRRPLLETTVQTPLHQHQP